MIAFLIILSVLILLALAGGYYMYRFACVRKSKVASAWDDDELFSKGNKFYEELGDDIKEKRLKLRHIAASDKSLRLNVTSFDGLTLAARFVPCDLEHPRGIIASFHGYRSDPSVDFGASSVDFLEDGFSILLVDQRAHGKSEGRHITFGVKERFDVISWCNLLAEMFPNTPVILDGLSMGATTVMTASALGLPDNVKAVIADCGFTTPAAICTKVLTKDLHLPRFPIYYAASLVTRILAGFGFNDISAPDSLRKSKLPTLIVHGTGDKFVPHEMGVENSEAAGENAVFLSVPEAGHGVSYLKDFAAYRSALEALFERAGIPNKTT